MFSSVFNREIFHRAWNFTCDVGREAIDYAIQHKAFSILTLGALPLLIGLKRRIFTHIHQPTDSAARTAEVAQDLLDTAAKKPAAGEDKPQTEKQVPFKDKPKKHVRFKATNEVFKVPKLNYSDDETEKQISDGIDSTQTSNKDKEKNSEINNEGVALKSKQIIVDKLNAGFSFEDLKIDSNQFLSLLLENRYNVINLNLNGLNPSPELIAVIASCPNLEVDLGEMVAEIEESEKQRLYGAPFAFPSAKEKVIDTLIPRINKGEPIAGFGLTPAEIESFILRNKDKLTDLNLEGIKLTANMVALVFQCPRLSIDFPYLIIRMEDREKSSLLDLTADDAKKKFIRKALVPELNKGLDFSYLKMKNKEECEEFFKENGKDINNLNLDSSIYFCESNDLEFFSLSSLLECKNLTKLSLRGRTRFLDSNRDDFIEIIKGLNHLEELDLSCCRFHKRTNLEEAIYPKSLRVLKLSNTMLDYKRAKAFIKSENLENLTDLDLSLIDISKDDIPSLMADKRENLNLQLSSDRRFQ